MNLFLNTILTYIIIHRKSDFSWISCCLLCSNNWLYIPTYSHIPCHRIFYFILFLGNNKHIYIYESYWHFELHTNLVKKKRKGLAWYGICGVFHGWATIRLWLRVTLIFTNSFVIFNTLVFVWHDECSFSVQIVKISW